METNQYEPKRKNRFIVVFPDSFGIEPWRISQFSRPQYDMRLRKWDDIVIEFIDPIGTPTSKSLYNIVEKNIYEISFDVEMLDPTGVVVEKWKIHGSIEKINFGELNYELDDLLKPTMTVQPISCLLV